MNVNLIETLKVKYWKKINHDRVKLVDRKRKVETYKYPCWFKGKKETWYIIPHLFVEK